MADKPEEKVKPQGGEGDREADRRYREKTERYAREHGEEAVKRNPAGSPKEAEEIEKAEKEAERRAREKDPGTVREYDKPTK